MHAFCGLDFGTSNSTIGVKTQHERTLVPLAQHTNAIRSAIFCDAENKQWLFGQEGVQSYLEGVPGRLLMALKSVLGSSLMDDKTLIFNEYIPYTNVLAHFIRHLKTKAERFADKELSQVVMGRPVHFHDHDETKDSLAQDTLEKIAREVGFKEVTFQYEPIAAAFGYEMSIASEQLAFIVDMGGGTSDFTLIRLSPQKIKKIERKEDVLANGGIHIAGTDFDQRLSLEAVMPLLGMGTLMRGSSSDIVIPSMFFHDLTTWHTLRNLYSANTIAHVQTLIAKAHDKERLRRLLSVLRGRAGHHILNAVEQTKHHLSDKESDRINLSFIEDELATEVTRTAFNTMIHEQVQQIISTITHTIRMAQIDFAEVNAIFYTGGSTKIPAIRSTINALFPHAKVIQGDVFGSVGMGLTIDAERKFGV